MAMEWQAMLDSGECESRAELARNLGVSRARVTQVLNLLNLNPKITSKLKGLGDLWDRQVVTERELRTITGLPHKQQVRLLNAMVEEHRTRN